MATPTLTQIIEYLPTAFVPEKAGDLETVIQFEITGEEAGNWILEIGNGVAKVEEGNHKKPAMTLAADSSDLLSLITGKLNPTVAFMRGKVKLDGNWQLAMKFVELFDFNKAKK